MRKTRLVILPGARSIHQIGCLLLFLACPNIAFKGQEKRDFPTLCLSNNYYHLWIPEDSRQLQPPYTKNYSTINECQKDNKDSNFEAASYYKSDFDPAEQRLISGLATTRYEALGRISRDSVRRMIRDTQVRSYNNRPTEFRHLEKNSRDLQRATSNLFADTTRKNDVKVRRMDIKERRNLLSIGNAPNLNRKFRQEYLQDAPETRSDRWEKFRSNRVHQSHLHLSQNNLEPVARNVRSRTRSDDNDRHVNIRRERYTGESANRLLQNFSTSRRADSKAAHGRVVVSRSEYSRGNQQVKENVVRRVSESLLVRDVKNSHREHQENENQYVTDRFRNSIRMDRQRNKFVSPMFDSFTIRRVQSENDIRSINVRRSENTRRNEMTRKAGNKLSLEPIFDKKNDRMKDNRHIHVRRAEGIQNDQRRSEPNAQTQIKAFSGLNNRRAQSESDIRRINIRHTDDIRRNRSNNNKPRISTKQVENRRDRHENDIQRIRVTRVESHRYDQTRTDSADQAFSKKGIRDFSSLSKDSKNQRVNVRDSERWSEPEVRISQGILSDKSNIRREHHRSMSLRQHVRRVDDISKGLLRSESARQFFRSRSLDESNEIRAYSKTGNPHINIRQDKSQQWAELEHKFEHSRTIYSRSNSGSDRHENMRRFKEERGVQQRQSESRNNNRGLDIRRREETSRDALRKFDVRLSQSRVSDKSLNVKDHPANNNRLINIRLTEDIKGNFRRSESGIRLHGNRLTDTLNTVVDEQKMEQLFYARRTETAEQNQRRGKYEVRLLQTSVPIKSVNRRQLREIRNWHIITPLEDVRNDFQRSKSNTRFSRNLRFNNFNARMNHRENSQRSNDVRHSGALINDLRESEYELQYTRNIMSNRLARKDHRNRESENLNRRSILSIIPNNGPSPRENDIERFSTRRTNKETNLGRRESHDQFSRRIRFDVSNKRRGSPKDDNRQLTARNIENLQSYRSNDPEIRILRVHLSDVNEIRRGKKYDYNNRRSYDIGRQQRSIDRFSYIRTFDAPDKRNDQSENEKRHMYVRHIENTREAKRKDEAEIKYSLRSIISPFYSESRFSRITSSKDSNRRLMLAEDARRIQLSDGRIGIKRTPLFQIRRVRSESEPPIISNRRIEDIRRNVENSEFNNRYTQMRTRNARRFVSEVAHLNAQRAEVTRNDQQISGSHRRLTRRRLSDFSDDRRISGLETLHSARREVNSRRHIGIKGIRNYVSENGRNHERLTVDSKNTLGSDGQAVTYKSKLANDRMSIPAFIQKQTYIGKLNSIKTQDRRVTYDNLMAVQKMEHPQTPERPEVNQKSDLANSMQRFLGYINVLLRALLLHLQTCMKTVLLNLNCWEASQSRDSLGYLQVTATGGVVFASLLSSTFVK